MAGSVIVAGARTPIGKLSGALASFSAADLGGFAIKGALERAGLTPEQVEYVFMGHVLQAGAGQITARQAAVKAGIPMSIPSTTVNKVCPSGMHSIYLADLMIQAGEADVIVAGGMESMTNAPYLLPGARGGYRLGDQKVVDSLMYDGLFDQFDGRSDGTKVVRTRPRRYEHQVGHLEHRSDHVGHCRRRVDDRQLDASVLQCLEVLCEFGDGQGHTDSAGDAERER